LGYEFEHVFTELVGENMADDDYRALQTALLLRPEQGPIIPGSGGLRKIRCGAKGGGKRGGLRPSCWAKSLERSLHEA